MNGLVIGCLVAVQVACIWIVVEVARHKQRDPELWGALALVLGVLAVALIVAVPPVTAERAAHRRRVPDINASSTFTDGHLPQWRGRR